MNPEEFAHRVLVNVARHIKDGKDLEQKEIVARIMQEEFQPQDPRYAEWLERVEKRVNWLLSDPEGDYPLLARFLQQTGEDALEDKPWDELCPTGAIYQDESGKWLVYPELCIGCQLCVDHCIADAIIHHSEFATVALLIMERSEHPVYAIVAPSFVGQFGPAVTPEKFKTALRSLGFADVLEVALAADVITRQEAEEFVRRMHQGDPFMITSCCCPVFIKLVEKIRPKIAHLVSLTVSPMIALGQMLKQREPDCKVVFIGPCLAKKTEARNYQPNGPVDCVLTYKELKALLEAAEVSLEITAGEEMLEDASRDGRRYAHIRGVTTAICNAVRQIAPDLEIKPVYGDGIRECSRLLKELEEGVLEANFMEGMGCLHGCIGGPGTLLPPEQAFQEVEAHAAGACVRRAFDNQKASRWAAGRF